MVWSDLMGHELGSDRGLYITKKNLLRHIESGVSEAWDAREGNRRF